MENCCIVCCSSLTSKPIMCHQCGYEVCETCTETYLLGITSDPHCMNCRCPWDDIFLKKHVRADFLEGCFHKRRMDVLSHRSNRQPEQTMMCPSCEKGNVDKTTFVCVSCHVGVCSNCFCIRQEHHECKKEVVCSLQTIRQLTRPCPGCHAPIEKQSGCFQMFCTHCFTAFDWNNGSMLDKDHLHNPHYTEYKTSINHLHKMSFTITDPQNKVEFQRFYGLVLDIERQIVLSYECGKSQTLCLKSIWSSYFKRGLKIIMDQSYNEMQTFQMELKEALLEYNEHVHQCLQLRGHRLFPPPNQSLFCF